jgi:DNA-binding MarR family transcriptional regulator
MLPIVAAEDPAEDSQILRSVWQLSNALAKRRNAGLTEYGLTGTQSEVISFLLRHTGQRVSVRDVQDYLMISHPTVSGTVRRLEAKGLLAQHKGSGDARRTYLQLTDEGLRVRGTLRKLGAASEAALLQGMSEGERAQFAALLVIARDNLAGEPSQAGSGDAGAGQ